VRTIISKDFATRHSLRFPRVERIRYDKSPFDVQTDQELWDLVNQNKGVVTGLHHCITYHPFGICVQHYRTATCAMCTILWTLDVVASVCIMVGRLMIFS